MIDAHVHLKKVLHKGMASGVHFLCPGERNSGNLFPGTYPYFQGMQFFIFGNVPI